MSDNIKRKYNILVVASDLHIGGAEQVIATLCRHIDKDLFNLSVCHLRLLGIIGDDLYKEGIDIIGIPESRIFRNDYLAFLKLFQIVRKKKIDIIHSHTTHSLVESCLCKLVSPGLKMVHTYHFGNYPHHNDMLLEKLFWRVPNQLVSVGNVQKKALQETYKIPDNKISTIWNGVVKKESAVDTQITNQFIGMNKIIIGSISTLIDQKGLTYLLDAMYTLKKKNENFILLVAGDGHLRSELELKSRQLGLDSTVFFLGWVTNAASTFLPVCDIFVQSSLWEAMSMVILEAMAAAKPIVATNVGENRHIIDSGKNGFLVESKDINAMAAALEKLISDPKLRAAFGSEAKKKWEKQFTGSIMTKNYEQLYLNVLNN